MTFLTLLQHLLQIDANDAVGDVIWEMVGKLVAGAAVLSGRSSDAERLLADGSRRLARAVTGPRQDRSGKCSSTCQCVCHGDVSRLDSAGSATTSPNTRQQSTESDTGSC